MRTLSLRGLPTVVLGQACADRFGGGFVQRLGHEDAADGGALLAALDRHLARHFLGQQLECLAARAPRPAAAAPS
jgi:hypothetical protein